ncbi:MAG TPA: hypothetical protein PKV97_01765 [Thauera aminoaromatica]|nr:hypothetical protein [Thauera aminoaromatica]
MSSSTADQECKNRIQRAKELSEGATADDFDFIDDEITTRRGGHLIAKIKQHGTSGDGRLFAEARTLLPAIAADYEKLQEDLGKVATEASDLADNCKEHRLNHEAEKERAEGLRRLLERTSDDLKAALAREQERAQKLHRRLITAEAALGTKREIAGVMEENRELRENNRRLKAYAERTQKQAADDRVALDKARAEIEALHRKEQAQCIYCDALLPKAELIAHLRNCGMQSEAMAAREREISKLRQDLLIVKNSQDAEKTELHADLNATTKAVSAVRFVRGCKCGFAARGNCEHYHGLFGFPLPPLPVGKE